MKKLLLLTAIIVLFSCEKTQHCKTCTTIVSGGGINSVTEFSACGDDLKAIDGKVITSTASVGSVTVTITSRTVCR